MASEKKMDYVLLGLLSHENLTGYDMKKRLDMRLHFFWNASFGSIYPTLAKLEQEKKISSSREVDRGTQNKGNLGSDIKEKLSQERSAQEKGRERIIYSITDYGQKTLYEWLKKPVQKDELRYETLLKLFFGNEAEPEVAIEHIKSFGEKTEKELAILEACVKQLEQFQEEKTHQYYLLTAKFGVETYKGYLKWCKEAVELLETDKKQ